MRRNKGKEKLYVGLALMVITVLLVSPAYLVYVTGGQDTVYQYEVKAEQVNEDEMTEGQDIIEYENLTEEQQEVLFRAFKESDNFLDGASVTVRAEQKYDVFNDWRIIEIRGVPMLVAISGPDEVPTPNQTLVNFGATMCAAASLLTGLVALSNIVRGAYLIHRYG